MGKYLIKRVISALITVFLVSFITFFLMNMVPGGPFTSEKAPSEAVLQAMNEKYGLDKPLIVQYKNYMVNLVQGDLGVSYKMQKNRPVMDIIIDMFPTSAKIGAIALLLTLLVGIPIGSVSAYHRGQWLDSLLMLLTTAGIALPSFVIATGSMIIFGVKLEWLPTFGLGSFTSYILPCFALSFYPISYVARLTRSSMLDVIHQDYIRTAQAKGLPHHKITFKHALRNSLIPVITYLGPLTAGILTGGFVVESVFNIPGLGRYFIQSISNRDYPLIMGTTIFLATLVVMMNLLVDLAYKFVDPRITLDKGEN